MWERDIRAVPELRRSAASDPEEKVRERAVGALTLLRDKGAPKLFQTLLASDPSARVRRAAADAIGTLGIPPDRIDLLTDPLRKDKDPLVRAECARAIGKLKDRTAVGPLIFSLGADPSPEVRALSAEALSRFRAPEAEGLLTMAAQQDRSPLVRLHALRALIETAPVSSRNVFQALWTESDDPDLRLEAYRGLLLSGDYSRWIEAGLADKEVPVRVLALRTWLNRTSPPFSRDRLFRTSPYVTRLETFLADPARGVRELSRQALEKLGYKVRVDGVPYTIDDR